LYKMAKFSKKKRSNKSQRGKRTRKLKGGTLGELQSLKQQLENEEKKSYFYRKSDKISTLQREIDRVKDNMKKNEDDKKRKEKEALEKAEEIKKAIDGRNEDSCVTDENKYIDFIESNGVGKIILKDPDPTTSDETTLSPINILIYGIQQTGNDKTFVLKINENEHDDTLKTINIPLNNYKNSANIIDLFNLLVAYQDKLKAKGNENITKSFEKLGDDETSSPVKTQLTNDNYNTIMLSEDNFQVRFNLTREYIKTFLTEYNESKDEKISFGFDQHYLNYLAYDMLKKDTSDNNQLLNPVEFNKDCNDGENIPMRDPILQTKLFIAFGGMVDTARSLDYLKKLLKSKPKNPLIKLTGDVDPKDTLKLFINGWRGNNCAADVLDKVNNTKHKQFETALNICVVDVLNSPPNDIMKTQKKNRENYSIKRLAEGGSNTRGENCNKKVGQIHRTLTMNEGCKTGTTNDVKTPMEGGFLKSFTNDSIPFLELTESKTFPSMDGKTTLSLPWSDIDAILKRADNERPPPPPQPPPLPPPPPPTQQGGRFMHYNFKKQDYSTLGVAVPTTTLQQVANKKDVIFKVDDSVDDKKVKVKEGFGQNIGYDKYSEIMNNPVPGLIKKIGVMVAGNSGLPGGNVGKKGTDVTLNHEKINANHTTQEEDIVSTWLTATCFSKNMEIGSEECKVIQTEEFNIIKKKWGFEDLEPLPKIDQGPPIPKPHLLTIQKMFYSPNQHENAYADAWVVRDAMLTTKKITSKSREKKKGTFSTEKIYPATLVFVAGPNAGAKGSDGGSMTRTYNDAAAGNYDKFKEQIKGAVRAGLDAMIMEGVDIAIVAGVSTGIYAPGYNIRNDSANQKKYNSSHHKLINDEFVNIINKILEEDMPETNGVSYKRGEYFDEVIYPKLTTK
jgi:hypothetical protein